MEQQKKSFDLGTMIGTALKYGAYALLVMKVLAFIQTELEEMKKNESSNSETEPV